MLKIFKDTNVTKPYTFALSEVPKSFISPINSKIMQKIPKKSGKH
jgi:hypothetical protein